MEVFESNLSNDMQMLSILLFITCHRHSIDLQLALDSISVFAPRIYQRLEVFVFNNNVNNTSVEQYLPHTKITYVRTSINDGYQFGHLEAIHRMWSDISRYDVVIHQHPDVMWTPATQDIVMKSLAQNPNSAFLVSPYFTDDHAFFTDFFIFRPNLMHKSPFHPPWKRQYHNPPERALYVAAIKFEISLITRRVNLSGERPDMLGLYHLNNDEEDRQRFKSYAESLRVL